MSSRVFRTHGWLALITAVLAPAPALAAQPAERGASFTAWAGAAVDRSVTVIGNGRSARDVAPMFGLTGVGNLGVIAIGGAVDGTPRILGDGRLSLSAVLGYQPEIAGTRLLLLGEGGGHRFSEVGGTVFAPQLGPDIWLPFVGARVGVARTLPRHGPFELGWWVFGRYDLRRSTVTNVGSFLGEETRTDYRLGGFIAGVALHGGLRIESSNPWKEETETEPEPLAP